MTDRELLEMAAKAAGMEIHHWSTILPGPMMVDPVTDECSHYWNPLEEDGDALRLAVKLRLQIDLMRHAVAVGYGRCKVDSLQRQNELCEGYENDEDPAAQTRRAIVRAAAAMRSGNADRV